MSTALGCARLFSIALDCNLLESPGNSLTITAAGGSVVSMKHVHAMSIRPDVIIKTGVIQPYAIREIPPGAVARTTVRAFESVARPAGPRVSSEIQPEAFAARAKTLAVAMAAGKRPGKRTDPKLIEAAKMIMAGKPFAIKSAGRVARVAAAPANNRVVRDHRSQVSAQGGNQDPGYWKIFQR